MRNAERVRAYQMRVSGMTWEAIGRAMHYDGQTIKRDLINSLTVDRKLSAIRFPALRKICADQFDGSAAQMALRLGMPESTFRNQMTGRTSLSISTVEAVRDGFGLSYEEAFCLEEGDDFVCPDSFATYAGQALTGPSSGHTGR